MVRPLGRTALLGGRFAAAAGVCGLYVGAVYAARDGDHRGRRRLVARPIRSAPAWPWSPGVILIAALSLLGSIFLSATANGIAVFMAFGAGLAAGLLGQIGDALDVDTLENVAQVASWALPFEALYQGGLDSLTEGVGGTTGVIVQLGPFGGAQEGGPLLWPWTAAYLVAGRRRGPVGVCPARPLSDRLAPSGEGRLPVCWSCWSRARGVRRA